MTLGQLAAHLHELQADQAQTSTLKPADHFPDQTTLHTVRLNENKGTL
jgi:hypothetical protein